MSLYGPDLERGDHIIVLGVPLSGKTTFAERLVRKARRLLVFDPGGDWESMRGAMVVRPADLDALPALKDRWFRVVVQAGRDTGYDVAEEFEYTARMARDAGDLVLVADEVGDYKRGAGERALVAMHRNGHKQGVVTVYVSQRAVDIPLGARATATRVYSFLQDSEDDLAALHESYDPSAPHFSDRVRAWKAGDPPVVWKRRQLYN